MTSSLDRTAWIPGVDTDDPYLRALAIAARQRNLITWRQLVSCGLPPSTIAQWARRHRLIRVFRGVYSMGAPSIDVDTRRLAATLACAGTAAIKGLPGLDLWDFTRFRTDAIELTVDRRIRIDLADVAAIHRSPAAELGHVTQVRGIPVTSVPWTITDLGTDLGQEQISHVIQQACIRRMTSRDELRAVLELRPNVTGRTRVVSALDAYESGSNGTRSFLEDLVVQWIREILGHVPLVNIHVRAGEQSFEVDISFLELRLCIEVDGPPHDEPDQQQRDRVRDAALRAAGYRVERFHWRDIRRRPETCRARLRKLLLGH